MANITLDIGAGVSQIILIYEVYVISKGILCIDQDGHDLTDIMKEILNESGFSFAYT